MDCVVVDTAFAAFANNDVSNDVNNDVSNVGNNVGNGQSGISITQLHLMISNDISETIGVNYLFNSHINTSAVDQISNCKNCQIVSRAAFCMSIL